MRYRLRTLMIVLALGPPLLAGGWLTYREGSIPDAFSIAALVLPVALVQAFVVAVALLGAQFMASSGKR